MKSPLATTVRVVLAALGCVSFALACTSTAPLDAPLGITVEGMTYDAQTNTFSGQFFAGGSPIVVRGTAGDTERNTIVTVTIDGANSSVPMWAATGMDIAGMVNLDRLVGFGTGGASVEISGTPAGIYRLRGTITVDDRVATHSANFDLELILNEVSVVSRTTLDADGNGHIDTVRLAYNANLNDDLGGFVVAISGYTVAGIDSGLTANDGIIDIRLNELAGFDTGARPSLQILASPNLADDTYAVATTVDPIQLVPDDGAAPVLVKAVASDGFVAAAGVDAGDSVEFEFSEIVVTAPFSPAEIDATFTLGNGHSWLDGSGQFGSLNFNFNKITLTLTDATASPTVADTDTITMAGTKIADAAGNAAIGAYTLNLAEGSFSPKMELVGRRTLDRDHNGILDAFELEFNLPVDDASIGTITAEINGDAGRTPTLASHPDGATTDNDVFVYVFFTEGAEKTGDAPTLKITDWDTLTSTAATGALAPLPDGTAFGTTDKAAPVLLSAFATDALNEVLGVDDDDFVVLTFSEPMQGTLDAATIDLVLALNNGHSWLDDETPQIGNIDVAGSTITVRLVTGANATVPSVVQGDTITVGGNVLADVAGNAAVGLNLAAVPITGTFDPTGTVTVLSRTTRDTDHNGFIDAIELVFDRAVNDAGFVAGDEVYIDGVLALVGDLGIDTGSVPSDDTLLLTFPEQVAPNYDTDRTPTLRIAAWQNLRDAATGARTFDPELSASVPADGANPILLLATASDATNKIIGPDGDDTVTLLFSEPLKSVTLNAATINSSLQLSGGHSWLDGAGSYTGTDFLGDTLVCRLAGNPPPPTIAEGDTVTPAALLEDPSGNPVWPTVTATIGGSFSSEFGTIARRTRDTDAKRNGRLDAIELEFSANLNDSFTGLTVSVAGRTVTEITTGQAANDNKILVVFAEQFAPDTDAVPTVQITAAGNLKDSSNAVSIAVDASPVVSTDGALPLLLSAVASDGAVLAPGVDADDTVTLVFSEPMHTTTPTSAQIRAGLNSLFGLGGHSWFDGNNGATSAVWADSKTLVVTLRDQNGPPTILPGDPVTMGVPIISLTQADGALTAQFSIAGLTITGHFGVGEADYWVSRVPMPTDAGHADVAAVRAGDSIVIFGGENAAGVSNAVAIYDTHTNQWRSSTALNFGARRGVAATALDGELILVAGGEGALGFLSNAFRAFHEGTWATLPNLPNATAYGSLVTLGGVPFYIGGTAGSHTIFYANNTWADGPTPNPAARQGGTAVVDGKIYYFGGDVSGSPTNSAFVYDPVVGKIGAWQAIAGLPVPLRRPGVTVHDGLVTIVGGITTGNAVSTAVFTYNPVSNSYSQVTTLPTARARIGGGVVSVGAGVYVLGGEGGGTITSRMQTFYPAAAPNRWRLKDNLPAARTLAGVVPWGTGALAFGGRDAANSTRTETYILDGNGKWSASTPLPAPRQDMGACIYGGYALCVGGTNGTTPTDTVFYREPTGDWKTAPPMSTTWSSGAVVPLGADLYRIGGQSGLGVTDTTLIFNFFDGGPAALRDSMATPRKHFAHAIAGGKIYVFGGTTTGNAVIASAEVYDPIGDAWSSLPDMPDVRTGCRAAMINGEIWVVGGSATVAGSGTRGTLIFDPLSGKWRHGPSLSQNTCYLGLASIGETLLRVGGTINDVASATDRVETLDRNRSGDGTLITLGGRRYAFSSVIFEGRVFSVGGMNQANSPVTTTAVYDESVGTVNTLAPLPAARAGVALTGLVGRLFAIGGGSGNSPDFDAGSNEFLEYSFLANTWTAGPNLPFNAYGAVAVSCFGSAYAIGGTSEISRFDDSAKTWESPSNFPSPPFAVTRFSQGVGIGPYIFVCGGATSPTGAAVFDVRDRKWTALPAMPNGHYAGAAIHLDGRIYVLGGSATPGGAAHAKVSVFDLARQSWSHGRPLPVAIQKFGAVAYNGEILLLGGQTSQGASTSVLKYRPLSERWTADIPGDYWRRVSPPSPSLHARPALVELGGKFYVIGGEDIGAPDGSRAASIFDPATKTWQSSTTPLGDQTPDASAIADAGLVHLVGGGLAPAGVRADYVTLDPGTRAFTASPGDNLPAPLTRISGALLDRVWYVVGGVDGTGAQVDSVRAFDLAGGGPWVDRAALAAPRSDGALIAVDGQLLLVGGSDDSDKAIPNVLTYDPAADAWRSGRVANLPAPRKRASGAVLDGFVYAVGGADDAVNQPSMWMYHWWQRAWVPCADVFTAGQSANSLVCVNGRLYRMGSAVANQPETRELEMYVPRIAAATPQEFRAEWAPMSNGTNVTGRRYGGAVWSGREMLAWGGEDVLGITGNARNGLGYVPNWDDAGVDPPYYLMNTGSQPSERRTPGAVWTSLGMVIFGGQSGATHRRDGDLYQPDRNQWLAIANPPGWGNDTANGRVTELVWTGLEVFVWGGRGRNIFMSDGKLYNPRTNSWRDVASNGPSARGGFCTGFTGKHVLVWGGTDGTNALADGKLYDPKTDAWSDVTASNAPSARAFAFCVWTGKAFIVWGGMTGPDASAAVTNTGAIFDPYDGANGSWTTMSTTDAPPPMARAFADGTAGRLHPHQSNNAIWTGQEMVIVFGSFGPAASTVPTAHQMWAFNPSTNTWRKLTDANFTARFGMSAVWSGDELLAWGGSSGIVLHRDGHRLAVPLEFDSAFTPTTLSGAPAAREQAAVATVGQWALVWGGMQTSNLGLTSLLSTGGAYHAGLDEWVTLSSNGAPSGRYGHVAADCGGFLVWGGQTLIGGPTNTGAILNWPTNDAWTAMSTNNAPAGRVNAGACSTGSGLLVFGGENAGNGFNDGGFYTYRSNTWMSLANPPAAKFPATGRVKPVVVWLGPVRISGNTEQVALIYGGYDKASGAPLDTGAFYSPVTDTWFTAVDDGPAVRDAMWEWTGKRLIVWGGNDGASPTPAHSAQGWEFNPYATPGRQWQAITGTNAPTARSSGALYDHGAGGAGKFTVLGGSDNANVPADLAEYDWFRDRWAILDPQSPLPNGEHRRTRGVEVFLPELGRTLQWGGWYNNSANPRQSRRGSTR